MTFSESVRTVLHQYATFTGRARRSEYWWFYLFTVLVSIATSLIDAVIDAVAFNNEVGLVGALASLALLVPGLAVAARRLHDTGRTGWWILLPVAPFVLMIGSALAWVFSGLVGGGPSPVLSGLVVVFFLALFAAAGITLIVFLCLDSEPGPNKYGASPKPAIGPGGYYPPAGYGDSHALPPGYYPRP